MSSKKPKPFSLDRAAKQLWHLLYPNLPWPRGWKVRWATPRELPRNLGEAHFQKKLIRLKRHPDHAFVKGGVIDTLAHEFIHVRTLDPSHGAAFKLELACSMARLKQAYQATDAANRVLYHLLHMDEEEKA